MANDVFANGREISCKKADGKTICAFPDVCMTPPTSPASPTGIPVPYPNTGLAKDTTKGSRSVKISGKEIIKKNVSHYKTSYGDEAGCATPAKKGIITGTIKGKVYFKSWSMDVKIEGKNVVRHLDMTTHNHKSDIGNESIPWPHVDRMSIIDSVDDCDNEKDKIKKECGDPLDPEKSRCPDPSAVDEAIAEHNVACKMDEGPEREAAKAAATTKKHIAHENYALEINKNSCSEALKCALVPYNKGSKKSKKKSCCPHQTPDHLVPASQFGDGRGASHASYKARKAPCMCATGGAQTAMHGLLGRGRTEFMENNGIPVNSPEKSWSVAESCECGASSAAEVTNCSKKCLEAQLKKGHEDMNVDLDEKIKTTKETVKRDLSEFKNQMQPANTGGPSL